MHRQTRLFCLQTIFSLYQGLLHKLLGRLEMGKALVAHSLCFYSLLYQTTAAELMLTLCEKGQNLKQFNYNYKYFSKVS